MSADPRHRVLNVNDRDATRYMVTQMLRSARFDVLEAATGEEALAVARRPAPAPGTPAPAGSPLPDAPPDAPPDAIVLDVRLPDLNGYEVCKRLKADPATASIPILMTSAAYVDTEHRVEGLQSGADAYLAQPFEPSELSAVLRTLLRSRAAERDAQRLTEELTDAIRIRDEFLSIAAHELRTPLMTLQLQLDSLARGLDRAGSAPAAELLPKLRGKVDTALRQTGRLTLLVDDLLDVARSARGALGIQLEEVDLERVVQDVVERFAPEAARAGSALTASTRGPVTACVDRLRIEQVLTNLISNALKYGRGQPVAVELTSGPERATLIVRDHGIGISPTDHARIFDRFERAVSARHYGGLGLGLFITGRIVEAHGGVIRVDSALDQGAAFVVELPRALGRSIAGPERREQSA